MHRELSCMPLGQRRAGKPSFEKYVVSLIGMLFDRFQHGQHFRRT